MAVAGSGVGVTERVAQVTLAKWTKKVSEQTVRKLVLPAMLQKRGQIKFGCSGGNIRWPVRKDDHPIRGFPDMVPVSFTRRNTKTNAYLEHRGYYAEDTFTLREKLQNGGPEAIVSIFDQREKVIREGATRYLASEFFVDGESADGIANERFHGIETMMAVGAQTASDPLATVLAGSYAGLSTAYGVVSGVSPSPLGRNHPLARTWSPVIVNCTLNPGAGVQAWADFAIEYIRTMLLEATYGDSEDDAMDVVLLNLAAYMQLLNLMDDKERLVVNRGSGAGLVSLGFNKLVEIDGTAVTWGREVPTTDGASRTVYGYGFTTSNMRLDVLSPASQKSLFATMMTFNGTYRADEFFMWLLGNIVFESPRRFGKLVAF